MSHGPLKARPSARLSRALRPTLVGCTETPAGRCQLDLAAPTEPLIADLMSLPDSSRLLLTRRSLALTALAASVAPASIGVLAPSSAQADGDGNHGGRDDDGGKGRGRGRGRGRHGHGSDDGRRGGGSASDRGPGGDDATADDDGGLPGGGSDDGGLGRGQGDDRDTLQPRRSPADIAVYYPDGWVERIYQGHYELMDDMSRLVVRRPATGEDFARMEALR